MAQFPRIHGISLANNSWIENLHVERLAADPVPAQPGRVWFNVTEKNFKFSSLDANGAVIIRSFILDSDVATALASAESYTDTKIAQLVDAAPALLDTLRELAQAIANDPNFVTTILNDIAKAKADLQVEVDGLSAALAAEVSRASNEESILQVAINTEEARAISAEASLDSRATSLEGRATTLE